VATVPLLPLLGPEVVAVPNLATWESCGRRRRRPDWRPPQRTLPTGV